MTGRPWGEAAGGGRCWLALLLLSVALDACQPLPHPFADDRPPAALLEIRDSAGVTIAPLVGEPSAVAKKLGGAIAKALLKRDIPASDKTANLDSYQLYGRVIESLPRDGTATVTAQWWLYDAKGRIVGKRTAQIDAATDDWQSARDAPIERLAGLSAERLTPLLEGKPPAMAAALLSGADQTRVAIDKISGAPGDGATSLAAAVAAVLRHQNLTVTEDDSKADVRIAGDVSLAPIAPDQQHVKIVWHVRRADGIEIGTVAQESDTPNGQLDGPWGDVAYSIALAANDGLMQLIAHGAPSPEIASQPASKPVNHTGTQPRSLNAAPAGMQAGS
jgi:hypothetical protein